MMSKRTDDGMVFVLSSIGMLLICLVLLPFSIINVTWQTRSRLLMILVGIASMLLLLAILIRTGVIILLSLASVLVLVLIARHEEHRNTPSESGRPPLPFDVF